MSTFQEEGCAPRAERGGEHDAVCLAEDGSGKLSAPCAALCPGFVARPVLTQVPESPEYEHM